MEKKGERFFLSSGFSPRSSRLRRSPLTRALDQLWFKRQIRDCSQSKENETRKSSSMKEQYPWYQRFFRACGDFSGSATTKVCERRYLGPFLASECKRQASEERPTRATGECADWRRTVEEHKQFPRAAKLFARVTENRNRKPCVTGLCNPG